MDRSMLQSSQVEVAVAAYLSITGCAELEQLYNGLDHRFSETKIRAALKKIGAVRWVSGNSWVWPKTITDADYIGNRYAPGPLVTRRKITTFRLPERKAA